MNLSNSKKTKLKTLLTKACQGWSKVYIVTLYHRIIQIVDGKKDRSYPQLELYFVFCQWLATHLEPYKGIKLWDKKTTHLLLKATQGISSIAFDKMTQDEFNEYFDKVKTWAATVVFECNVETMIINWKESA